MSITVIVLTKSSKYGAHCVAGLDYQTGEWIRLVSDDEEKHGALSDADIQYEDGSCCEPCDLVEVEVIAECPLKNQPENILIDKDYYWKKTGQYSIEEIIDLYPPGTPNYIFDDTHYYVTEDHIDDIGYSLVYVCVKDLVISQVVNFNGSPKTKASFTYQRQYYQYMAVTDPMYYSMPDQTTFNRAILVLSLPDSPFPPGRYYKFIAQIYPININK